MVVLTGVIVNADWPEPQVREIVFPRNLKFLTVLNNV